MAKYSFWLLLAAVFIATVGCEEVGHKAFVSGEVKVDGQLVAKGSISFMPEDGLSPTTGTEIIDGKYDSAVPLGKSKVEIRVPRKIGQRKLYDTPDSPVQDTFEEVLPAKFNTDTKLTYTAQPGKNQKDWDLSTAVEEEE